MSNWAANKYQIVHTSSSGFSWNCINDIFRFSEESSVSPSGNTGLSTAHRKGHGGAEQGIKDPAIVYSCSVYWIRKFTRGGRQPWKTGMKTKNWCWFITRFYSKNKEIY